VGKEIIMAKPKRAKAVTVVKGGTVFAPKIRKGLLDDGWIIIKGGKITKIGEGDLKKTATGDRPTVVNATGKIVLPGFINCHTHFYSTLARGITLAGYSPRNFKERLESLWWRLDKALTYEDCYWSALVGSVLSLKAGVTTVFDHHSSPGSIDKSLDATAGGMGEAGIRGSTCYEVTDRDGQDRASLGIYENVRFARALKRDRRSRIGSFMGLHASFTLSLPTLFRARDAANDLGLGFHLHVAEDMSDVRDSQKKYRRRVVTRLSEAGILSKKTLAIHCVHVSDSEIMLLRKTGTNVITCPRSNLSNAVGASPVGKMFRHGIRVGFGSDGFGYNILDDAYTGILAWRLAERLPDAGSVETRLMLLRNNPIIASRALDIKLGEIAEGHAGDLVILSYDSPTPLDANNLWAHLLNGELVVDKVLVGGKVVVEDGRSCLVDETRVFEKARRLAADLWRRI
jgi:putative selenium metabolism protein SsnA